VLKHWWLLVVEVEAMELLAVVAEQVVLCIVQHYQLHQDLHILLVLAQAETGQLIKLAYQHITDLAVALPQAQN
jgi:hypothetical protein